MAIWNQLRQSAQGMQDQLIAKKNDLKSGAFRDASMAMCALVAAADGTIDAEERRRVAGLITTNDALSNFAADDLRAKFDGYANKLSANFDFGKGECHSGDRQGEEEAERGPRCDPDRHHHRWRRRQL